MPRERNSLQPAGCKDIAANIFAFPTGISAHNSTEHLAHVPFFRTLLEANALPGAHFNHSPNDGTITRFGWKAQVKSLLMFAGEAYNVEQGVTNELFPNERDNNRRLPVQRDPRRRDKPRSREHQWQPGVGLFVGHRELRGIHAAQCRACARARNAADDPRSADVRERWVRRVP